MFSLFTGLSIDSTSFIKSLSVILGSSPVNPELDVGTLSPPLRTSLDPEWGILLLEKSTFDEGSVSRKSGNLGCGLFCWCWLLDEWFVFSWWGCVGGGWLRTSPEEDNFIKTNFEIFISLVKIINCISFYRNTVYVLFCYGGISLQLTSTVLQYNSIILTAHIGAIST